MNESFSFGSEPRDYVIHPIRTIKGAYNSVEDDCVYLGEHNSLNEKDGCVARIRP